VPDQLVEVGFNGIGTALIGGVRVTTVAMPLKKMMSTALQLVVAQNCGCSATAP